MPKDLYQFPCPCCGKQIEIDTRSGKARAMNPGEAKGGQDLDGLLQKHQRESSRLGELFDQAKQGHGKQKKELEDRLQRAVEDAKKNKDEKLNRPFDLD